MDVRKEKNKDRKTSMFQKLLMLFVFGFLLVFMGILILIVAVTLSNESSISFGGVIFIWFVPIAIGVGQNALTMVFVAVILAILGIVLLIVFQKMKLTKN